MRFSAPDSPVIPSIEVLWDPKKDEYLVVSHAHDYERGINTTAGIEIHFNCQEMETQGLPYVLKDLEGFMERRRQTRTVDREAAFREARRRNEVYKLLSINSVRNGDAHYLDIYPMVNERGHLGSMSVESGPLRLALPTTSEQFLETIKTAFSQIPT